MLKETRKNSLFSFFETNDFNEFVNFVGSKILSEEICLIQLSIKDGKSKSYSDLHLPFRVDAVHPIILTIRRNSKKFVLSSSERYKT